MDKAKDIYTSVDVYYVGTSLSLGHQETLPPGSSEETIFALREDKFHGLKSQQFTKSKALPSFIKQMKQSIKEKL